MTRGIRNRLISFVLCAFCCGVACGQYETTLNPKDYPDADGRFTLHVEPSSRFGDGASEMSLRRDGKLVWQGEYDFTLWHAVLTEDGEVFGVAFEHGVNGLIPYKRRDGAQSRIFVVRVDQAGDTTVVDEIERWSSSQFSCYSVNPMLPIASGVVVQPEAGRLVVSFRNATPQGDGLEWRVYRLSDGAMTDSFRPAWAPTKKSGWLQETGLVAIPQTPLVLARWSVRGYWDGKPMRDAMLQVTDTDGRVIWTSVYEGEYESIDQIRFNNAAPGDPAFDTIRPRPGGFAFSSSAEQATATHLCVPDPSLIGGWQVIEIDRAAYSADDPALALAEADQEIGVADIVGRVRLESEHPDDTVFWRIIDFDISRSGSIGMLRIDSQNRRWFTLLTDDGAVIRERDLGGFAQVDHMNLISEDDGRWLLTCSGFEESRSSVSRYDPETDQMTALPHGKSGAIREPAGLPGGGFVAFVGPIWSKTDSIAAFDRDGRKNWRHDDLRLTKDIEVTRDGEVLVLGMFDNVIRRHSLDGKELEGLEIRSLGPTEFLNSVDLVALDDGDVLYHNSENNPELQRLDASMKLESSFRFEDQEGRWISPRRDIRLAPGGGFWATNGRLLIRCDENDKWQRVLGDHPDGAPFRHADAIALGPGDALYAVNSSNQAIHRFDAQGRQTGVFLPDQKGLRIDRNHPLISVSGDSEAASYPGLREKGKNFGASVIDRDGNRNDPAAEQPLLLDGPWRFAPGTREKWQALAYSLRRFNEEGELAAEITMAPNGDWLDWVDGVAISRDGSIAVRTAAGADLATRTGCSPLIRTAHRSARSFTGSFRTGSISRTRGIA